MSESMDKTADTSDNQDVDVPEESTVEYRGLSATYSPDDNKLRLYAVSRLSPSLYARVKESGFRWAPKQELFVCPAWSPDAEDLLIELCGEIGDEDTTLTERAEAKAERLEDLSNRTQRDAEHAHNAVEIICSHIPFGQPILVGHHSEKRARKDAERIENGMRKAVKLWEASKYWADRAQGAIANAKYKELPAVRHRRIKGLQADLRKCIKNRDNTAMCLKVWSNPNLTMAAAIQFANYADHSSYEWKLADYPRERPSSQYEGSMSIWSALTEGVCTLGQAAARRIPGCIRYLAHIARWVSHYENRIAYEKAMLDESGGIKADGFDLQPGGQVLNTYGEWTTILRVNRTGGAITSVSTNNRNYPRVIPVERIKDYKPPTEELTDKTREAVKLPPICNYPGNGFIEITQEQWNGKHKDYKGTRNIAATDLAGEHRVRSGVFTKTGGFGSVLVYITDAKVKEPPAANGAPPRVKPSDLPKAKDLPTLEAQAARIVSSCEKQATEESSKFAALKGTLKAGVQVVSVPQLFATPADLAVRIVELAELHEGHSVLEPSAGTGSLVKAVLAVAPDVKITTIEINQSLVDSRRAMPTADWCADFLERTSNDIGTFDRIVMNPPFANGADIKHIEHAQTFLKPGGRLVAICANGPRQHEKLKPIASQWIDLPTGSFSEQGTHVNTAILIIDRDKAPVPVKTDPAGSTRQACLFE